MAARSRPLKSGHGDIDRIAPVFQGGADDQPRCCGILAFASVDPWQLLTVFARQLGWTTPTLGPFGQLRHGEVLGANTGIPWIRWSDQERRVDGVMTCSTMHMLQQMVGNGTMVDTTGVVSVVHVFQGNAGAKVCVTLVAECPASGRVAVDVVGDAALVHQASLRLGKTKANVVALPSGPPTAPPRRVLPPVGRRTRVAVSPAPAPARRSSAPPRPASGAPAGEVNAPLRCPLCGAETSGTTRSRVAPHMDLFTKETRSACKVCSWAKTTNDGWGPDADG